MFALCRIFVVYNQTAAVLWFSLLTLYKKSHTFVENFLEILILFPVMDIFPAKFHFIATVVTNNDMFKTFNPVCIHRERNFCKQEFVNVAINCVCFHRKM